MEDSEGVNVVFAVHDAVKVHSLNTTKCNGLTGFVVSSRRTSDGRFKVRLQLPEGSGEGEGVAVVVAAGVIASSTQKKHLQHIRDECKATLDFDGSDVL